MPMLIQKLRIDTLVATKRTKMVAIRHTSLPQNIPLCFCSEALNWTTLGMLTALPDLTAGLGAKFLVQRGREDKKGGEGRKRQATEGEERQRAQKGWSECALIEMQLTQASLAGYAPNQPVKLQ